MSTMTIEFDYIIRIIVAGALGALIGLEREKRFKEAGLRTHFLVAVGSAVFMIVSKYAFQDVIGENVTLDPSRVAAAIPSGIGFLGAGMILVQRTSIRGLTTAAGIWATAGIGLAVGAGMYFIGIFAGLLVILGLEFLKLLFSPVIPKVLKLYVEVSDTEVIQNVIDLMTKTDITIKDYHVKLRKDEGSSGYSISIKLQSGKRWKENDIVGMLQKTKGVTTIRFGK